MAKGWGETPCPDVLPHCNYEPPFADDHHTKFPAHEYTTPLEKKFRALEVNIVRGMCRCLHDLEHLKEPPQKPSRRVMRSLVEGEA